MMPGLDDSSIASQWEILSGKNNWEGLLNPVNDDLRRYLIHYGKMVGAIVDAMYNMGKYQRKSKSSMHSRRSNSSVHSGWLSVNLIPSYNSNSNTNTNSNSSSNTNCNYNNISSVYSSSSSRTRSSSKKSKSKSKSKPKRKHKRRPCRLVSPYRREELLERVGLTKGNPFAYEVTKLIYMRSEWINMGDWMNVGQSSWIGYVAVSTDEGTSKLGRRDILVCWRGTNTPAEWWNNAKFNPTKAEELLGLGEPKVHSGFYRNYIAKHKKSGYNKKSARDQVVTEIDRLVSKYKKEKVSITVAGHSLGGALATLSAADIIAHGYNKPTNSTTFPVTVFAYASPQVGDEGFLNWFNEHSNHLRLLRIQDASDIVPTILSGFCKSYRNVGIELNVDSTKSKYLSVYNFKQFIWYAHDLNICLHGIAGDQGTDQDFELVSGLDDNFALVNKYTDALKPGYGIPSNWWTTTDYSGMIQMDNGSWGLVSVSPTLWDASIRDEKVPDY